MKYKSNRLSVIIMTVVAFILLLNPFSTNPTRAEGDQIPEQAYTAKAATASVESTGAAE